MALHWKVCYFWNLALIPHCFQDQREQWNLKKITATARNLKLAITARNLELAMTCRTLTLTNAFKRR